MTNEDTLIQERKRKFLIALPLLTVPFIVFLFYSLGGGKGSSDPQRPRVSALSTTLPDPLVDDRQLMDKLSIYQRAAKDSEKLRQSQAYDPFAEWMPVDSNKLLPSAEKSPFSYSTQELPPSMSVQSNRPAKRPEIALEQKIAALEKALQTPDTPATPTAPTLPPADISPELERLETMMQYFSEQSPSADPEMKQAENLIDKILDIQHPERVRNKIKEQSLANKQTVYAVTAASPDETIDLLQAAEKRPITTTSYSLHSTPAVGFYDEETEALPKQNALLAAVHESQTLVSGATIKIRLEQDAFVQGQLISKGSFVFGICHLNGERLEVSISSVRHGNSIYPVSLTAYDLDGLPGLRIPGSISREASKEGSEQAIQTLSMGTLDPSLGAQATAAGIEAAKTLLTKKVKLVKVSVKAGYPLLLATDSHNF